MLIALGTVVPDVPHKQPQHKYMFTLRFVSNMHNSGEPGCGCPGPWCSPPRARPAPSAHAATCTPLCWGNPKAGVRDSLPCSVRLSSPLPALCCPPGLAVWGCNPSPPCFTWNKGCSCSQYRIVMLSCVQWVSAGFHPSPAEGGPRTWVSCLLNSHGGQYILKSKTTTPISTSIVSPTAIPAASLHHCQSPSMALKSSATWLADISG